ncbi:NmrA family NAD(P)-binding protein [Saccharothrix obliqua]|uniref:NmrA family NAD(P)-binding protein n=1 Tax=Saccharothrix obliqua TaxID=2861747 RepID=UPI001C5EEE61|nr:NAD(P)H-binding protein [Saccharothrix obliqua]MBW4722128.1 NAD(P)H-binding protein [Saccharothrix obliqua]
MEPILVTGATGTVGRAVVRQLLEAGHEVRALTRYPDQARLPAGVEVVGGSFLEPSSLVPALRGVRRVHLVSIGGDGPAIADVLRRAGVERLTHLGHNDPSRPDDDPLETWHRVFHRAIEASGAEWTHVFPGEFMANTLEWAPGVRAESVVRAPFGDWSSALVHEDDIAGVVVRALLEDGHAGRAYQPTGPEPVLRRDAVRMIGEAVGRPVEFVELTPAQAREHWRDLYPPQVVEWFLEMGTTPDANAWVSPDVAEVLGRPGLTFDRWAREHAAEFA